jgi:hypothetical protein
LPGQDSGREPDRRDPRLVGEQAQEVGGERQHVLAAIDEGQQPDRKVRQVAKGRCVGIGGRRSDHARLQRNALAVSLALIPPLDQRLRQHLSMGLRQPVDRGEEERAGRRARQRTRMLGGQLGMAGCGAPEDLASNKGVVDGGARDADERPGGAAAPGVDRAREVLLPAAGRADDAYRERRGRRRHRQVHSFACRTRGTDDAIAASTPGGPVDPSDRIRAGCLPMDSRFAHGALTPE